MYISDSFENVLKGMNALADAVNKTIGPRGRNILLDKGYGVHTVANDGYEAAKVINFSNPLERIGAEVLKDAAKKTHELVGDGCSITISLAQGIINEGIKNIQAGSNPVPIRKGIRKAVEAVTGFIYSNAIYCSSFDDYLKLLSVVGNDEEIISIMGEVVKQTSSEQIVTIEESKEQVTTVEMCEGMTLDNGYISPYFAHDKDSMEIILDEPYILLTDKVIANFNDILPVIEAVNGRDLLIVAQDVIEDALSNLILNVLKGRIKAAAVKAGAYGVTGFELLNDIAAFTGGRVIECNMWEIEKYNTDNLGSAKRVRVGADVSVIMNGMGSKSDIVARINELKMKCKCTDSPQERLRIRNRIAKINTDTIIIKVGAFTNTELQERKKKYEKVLSSFQAALTNGLCPGGGVMYLKAINEVNKLAYSLSGDERIGAMILATALTKPAYYICENAGLNGEKIVADILEAENDFGYDVLNEKYVDMIENGIADPAKSLAIALENAAGLASVFLTSKAVVT